MLALLIAQADDATDFVNEWWPIVAVFMPILVGLATRLNASSRLKLFVSLGFSAAAGLVTLAGFDTGSWSQLEPNEIFARIAQVFLVAEATYLAVNELVTRTLNDRGLNALSPLRPQSGLGGGRRSDLMSDRRA